MANRPPVELPKHPLEIGNTLEKSQEALTNIVNVLQHLDREQAIRVMRTVVVFFDFPIAI